MAAVQQLIVETLKDLSYGELYLFMLHLKKIIYQRNPSLTPEMLSVMSDTSLNSYKLGVMMMEHLGQQSLEETRKILLKMRRTDLVQRLSGVDSGAKGETMNYSNNIQEVFNMII